MLDLTRLTSIVLSLLSQITSMSQIFMDPYYRTVTGLIVLIEKEWLSFGHKFGERAGRSEKGETERSPIFQQFLEALALVLIQKPESFEFNEKLLLALVEHQRSGWFGTFLLNTEVARRDAATSKRTVSLWSFIESNRIAFTRPNFDMHAHMNSHR